MGMLKKTASGVLAMLPCSRTVSTLRASKWLRPCWTAFFGIIRNIWLYGSYRIYGSFTTIGSGSISPELCRRMPLSGVMGHCCVRRGHDEIGSYTRKNVHRKKKQVQEVSCIQNGMGVGGEPYIAYDPDFSQGSK